MPGQPAPPHLSGHPAPRWHLDQSRQALATPSDEVVIQAVAWRVRLASGLAVCQDWQRCADWRAADPLHERAWLHLQPLERCLSTVSQPLDRAPLTRAELDRQRRRSLGWLALLAVVIVAGVTAQHLLPW